MNIISHKKDRSGDNVLGSADQLLFGFDFSFLVLAFFGWLVVS
jgi:hypothetical protein